MRLVRIREKLVESVLFLCAASSIGIVAFLVLFMFYFGYPAFINWVLHGFGMFWEQTSETFGIIPFIFATMYVGLGAMALGAAIGIPTAIYLAEFASHKVRNVVKSSIEVLVGIPSIVLGMFGLIVIVSFLVRNFSVGHGVLAAWIVLAIMSLPHIASISEDSLRAVPGSYREAALALGATRWQAIRHVLLPAAKSGITASLALALGNAVGETMAVYMVIGGASVPPITLNPAVSSNIITRVIATQYSEVAWGSAHWEALFGLGIILFIIVATLNAIVTRVVRRGAAR